MTALEDPALNQRSLKAPYPAYVALWCSIELSEYPAKQRIATMRAAQLLSAAIYLLILLVTITLTWATDVNAIIAYASRAFALFYMFQCIVAFMVALQNKELSHRTLRLANFVFLAVICFLVFALGYHRVDDFSQTSEIIN